MFQDQLKKISQYSFSEIVASVSADQIQTVHFLQTLPKLKAEIGNDPLHQKELQQKIKEMETFLAGVSEEKKKVALTDDTLTNIAYFARIIEKVHPGWEQEGFETAAFKKEVETLYNHQAQLPKEQQLKGRSLLKEFFKITAQTISDNHLTVKTQDGQFPMEEGIVKALENWKPTKISHPDGMVGKNIGYRIGEEIKPDEILALEYMDKGQKAPVLVAERMVGGQKTGIIAFPSCMIHWGGKTQMQEIASLRKVLDVFHQHQKDWENVIIDVRQNHGGDGFPIREVAETLYGNKVPYCLGTQRRQTQESQMRLFSAIEEEDYIGPVLPFKGEQKGLYVLVDREVASSAEAIVPMLKHYPGVKFVGENTCGCCQYGALQPIALPNGGRVNIGSVYRSYEDGMVECIGHEPDINCHGRDAFREAISQITGKSAPNLSRPHNESDR